MPEDHSLCGLLWSREMREQLRTLSENEKNKQWLYVTDEDIKSLSCFQNETLIAIKAPHGTTLEVPDPDEVCLSILVTCYPFMCLLIIQMPMH